MKKLMIAAAVAALAVASQASTYKWTFSSSDPIMDGYNAATVGGTSEDPVGEGLSAYLIYYTNLGTTQEPNYSGLSQSDLLAAIRGGKDMSDASIAKWILAESATADNGRVTKTDTFTTQNDNPEAASYFQMTSAEKMQAYMVILTEDGENIFLGTASTKTGDTVSGTDFAMSPTTTKNLRDNDGTKDFGSAGWYSTVPEPTSGLLLLLGVAGLALRRRRA